MWQDRQIDFEKDEGMTRGVDHTGSKIRFPVLQKLHLNYLRSQLFPVSCSS